MITDQELDRMSFAMYVIYVKLPLNDGRDVFVPHVDVHGQATAFHNKASASPKLYEMRRQRNSKRVRLVKVGPIS